MYLFKNRNFLLTLGASLALGVAMFGAVEYIPTYLQMALGVSATVAGLLMIPMMGVMLVVSIVTGLSLIHICFSLTFIPLWSAAMRCIRVCWVVPCFLRGMWFLSSTVRTW